MPDDQGNETREEALERIRIVSATQIFGDTPTDPTIGDVVVVAHNEEGANVAAAEVAAQAEDDPDGEASELSQEEAKRQLEPLDAEEVDEAAEGDGDNSGTPGDSNVNAAGGSVDSDDSDSDDSDSDGEQRNAADVVEDIKSASSVEEVDRLAAERPDAVTVERAAEAKREELNS